MDDVEDGNTLTSNDIFCRTKLHNNDESDKLLMIFNSIFIGGAGCVEAIDEIEEYATEKENFVNVADTIILQLYEDGSSLQSYTFVEKQIVFYIKIVTTKDMLY